MGQAAAPTQRGHSTCCRGAFSPCRARHDLLQYKQDANSVRYGQLRNLVEVPMGGTVFKLAAIQPLAPFESSSSPAVEAVVGRLKACRGRWCVLDRVELHQSAGDAVAELP
ncbi:hypothetical protein CALCODRAFT_505142, partial [Calocera cornea HHB12733]